MDLTNAVALVTGANRGIGRTYAEHLARAGTPRVYAAARDTSALLLLQERFPAIVPLHLDVTDRVSDRAGGSPRRRDVNLLINNAGILRAGGITERASLDDAREEMEVNYFGLLEVSRAFAPILTANAPSAMIKRAVDPQPDGRAQGRVVPRVQSRGALRDARHPRRTGAQECARVGCDACRICRHGT